MRTRCKAERFQISSGQLEITGRERRMLQYNLVCFAPAFDNICATRATPASVSDAEAEEISYAVETNVHEPAAYSGVRGVGRKQIGLLRDDVYDTLGIGVR